MCSVIFLRYCNLVFSFLHRFQDRPSRDKPLGFTIAGGKESGFGIFVSKVKETLLHTGCLLKCRVCFLSSATDLKVFSQWKCAVRIYSR